MFLLRHCSGCGVMSLCCVAASTPTCSCGCTTSDNDLLAADVLSLPLHFVLSSPFFTHFIFIGDLDLSSYLFANDLDSFVMS